MISQDHSYFRKKKHFKDSLLVSCHTHNHVFLPLSLPLRVYVYGAFKLLSEKKAIKKVYQVI